MRTVSFVLLIALAACRDTESADRFAALEAELAQVRAELEELREDPVGLDLERLSTGVDANTAAIATQDTEQAALTEAVTALTERVEAVEGALGTTGSDLGAFVDRLDALESEDVAVNARIDTVQGLIAGLDSRVITVEGDYVVSGSLDGVLTEAMLGDDFDDLQALLDVVNANEVGLADATERLDTVETDGVSQDELSVLDGRLTSVESDYVSGAQLATLDGRLAGVESDYVNSAELGALDGRLTGVESDYVSASEVVVLGARLTSIEGDYLTSQSLDNLEGRVLDIESDYVSSGAVTDLDARLSTVESDYLTSGDYEGVDSRLGAIESDYVGQPELDSVSSEVDRISADYVSNGELGIVQGQVDDILADYASASAVGELDLRVSDIETDYLTSVDRSSIDDELSGLTDLLIGVEGDYQSADDDLLGLIADNESAINDIGGAQRQEVFRLSSGGGSWSNATSWGPHVGGASGVVSVPDRPFNWALVLGGHYVDDSGKTMRFRLRYANTRTGQVAYIPDSSGFRKYLYVDHSRLEEQTMVGVDELPAGDYDVRLEFYQETGSGRYSWSSSYGQIVHTVW